MFKFLKRLFEYEPELPNKVVKIRKPVNPIKVNGLRYIRPVYPYLPKKTVDGIRTPMPINAQGYSYIRVIRFLDKVKFDEYFGCWVWKGGNNGAGYGKTSYGKQTIQAHRLSYMMFVGPIPEGLEIDHLCYNTMCVSPGHLEAVTRKENLARKRK